MKKLITVALMGMVFFACSKKEETTETPDNFPYDGEWIGTYNGSDSGTVTIMIAQDGKLDGTAKSVWTLTEFTLTGNVKENGEVTAASASTGATFTGSLSGSSGSGTWTNGTAGGNWVGTKK